MLCQRVPERAPGIPFPPARYFDAAGRRLVDFDTSPSGKWSLASTVHSKPPYWADNFVLGKRAGRTQRAGGTRKAKSPKPFVGCVLANRC